MEHMKVVDLKVLAKERGLRGYSKLKKSELITFLQNNLQLRTRPLRPTRPPPPPPAWEPIDDRPRPTPPSVRFRPDRPRQPPPNLRPYQLKPKRGKETFIEPPVEPTSNQKQIKRMKKKLGKLNKKIRHSKKKHNNWISKRSSIKKKIEELKGPREPTESDEPEASFNPIECEQAFGRTYRSYRINGRHRMDVDTFFNRIRKNIINLMTMELGSARVQTTTWIRFRQALEDDFGNVIGFDRVELPFNSRMTEIFQGSNLNEIVNEMFTHMKTQIENPALRNSRFVFDEVLFLDVNFHQLNLTRGSSYIPLPSWIANKNAVINPKNENDEECFKWAVIAGLDHKEIKSHPERISNLERFANNYDWSGLKYPVAINKISKFEKNNNVSVNILGVKGQQIYICRKSKYNNQKNIVNLLLITDGEKRHYTVI